MTRELDATAWVIRDAEGYRIEVHLCESREEALRRFCAPALLWAPFEEGGWTCREERNS